METVVDNLYLEDSNAHTLKQICCRRSFRFLDKDSSMVRAVWLLATALALQASAVQAAPISTSFDLVGQAFGGQDASVTISIGSIVPTSAGVLDLFITGDYDTRNEFLTASIDGTPIGFAGTLIDNSFLGSGVVKNGVGNISFVRSLVIDLPTLLAAFADGTATILFDRTIKVGGNPASKISGTLTFSAAVPEPSTMMLASLGLLVTGGTYVVRRRGQAPVAVTAA